jgi:hypothetical protein
MLCDYEVVDFERKWNDMVAECKVHDNNWVLDSRIGEYHNMKDVANI